jgi:hypothetical protein
VPLAPVQLRANEECSLPDIALAPAGHVEILLAAGAPRIAQLRLLREDGETAAWLYFDGDVVRRETAPGLYRAIAQIGDGWASLPVRVRSNETTRATLAFTPAALVHFECRYGGSRPEGRVLVRVFDASNLLVDTYELHLHMRGEVDSPTVWENRLPPGTYRLEARADDGRAATRPLTIADATDTPSVVFELPAR